MRNKLLAYPFLALLTILTITAEAQTWERIYYSEPIDDIFPFFYSSANKIFLEDDGSFLFAANVQEQNQFVWTDANGYIINTANAPSSNSEMIRSSDQNFVIASRLGTSSPLNEDVRIAKYDIDGNLIWDHHPEGYIFGNEAVSELIQTSDGHYIIVGARGNTSSNEAYPYISKVAEDGNLLWKIVGDVLPENNIFNYDVVETSDGGYFMAGSSNWFTTNNPIITDATKLDVNGNVLWTSGLETDLQVVDMLPAEDGSIVLLGRKMNYDFGLLKIDANGATIWESTFPSSSFPFAYVTKLISTNDGGYAVLANTQGETEDIHLLKLSNTGTIQWERSYGGALNDQGNDIIQLEDDGFLISGSANGAGEDAAFYIIRTDVLGNSLTDVIEGQVRYDTNTNCIPEAEEQALENWIVSASNEGGTYYAAVDENGQYNIEVGAETFEVVLHEPNDYWNTCVDSVLVDVTTNNQLDFAEQSVEQCPLMEVSVQSTVFVLCEQADMNIVYENQGTSLAEAAYIEITLADSLQLTAASIPYTVLGDNNYSFAIGDVDFLTSGAFTITVQVGCDIELMGQSLCVDAHIYPDESCLSIDPEWSGASIAVSAQCIGDEANFVIKNVGNEDMIEALQYTVIEDHVIMLQGQTYGPLIAGASINIPKPANGHFYRIESEQVAHHPGISMPSAFIEACGTGEDGSVSLGFVNQFPLNDAATFEDITCLEVVAAYDPNVKQATPIGFDEEHFISANTSIDYIIKFQNTGTAPANKVVITDQLSKDLDPATINLAASSHLYDFELLADGLMRFTFNDIALPDSTTNERESHGFVSFKINQQKDLAIGTIINNTASIFFDYNPAIITNTTHHTIGENFITVNIGEVLAKDIKITVSPNPFSTLANIHLEGEQLSLLNIRVFDASGKELINDQFSSTDYELKANHLAKGIHFYQILQNGILLNTGQLIVQ